MGTVIAVESAGGVALAGDSRWVGDGTVESDQSPRVVEYGTVGAGIVGALSDVQTFDRQFEAELRRQRLEHDGLGIDRIAQIAARTATASNVDVVITARDADGVARLRQIGADGSVLEESVVALGTGAEAAFSQLDAAGDDLDIETAANLVRATIETVATRDTETGGTVTVWTLLDAEPTVAKAGDDA
ncbi:20S proteasome subunit A/B [Halorarius litoreus]|uniref:20S proteasome subunit A/B n=1 Tax=Halorarius litoreus TaxID=2962676 RepID=UPI0020CEAC5A|nr:20S proteasome subunit A/B [Halorarius litoreus]